MTSSKIHRPLFIPTIKQFHIKEPSLDIVKLCIKNPHFFKNNFQGFFSIPHSTRVIKRNLKYLKAAKHCRFKSSASFYKARFAIQAEEYGTKSSFAPFGYHFIIDDARKNPTQFLRKLTLNGLTSQSLSLKLASFTDFTKKKCNLRELKDINMLKISNIGGNQSFQGRFDRPSADASPQTLKNISLFTHLQSLFIEIAHPGCDSKTFYDVLKTVSEASVLKSLKIRMNFSKMNHSIDEENLNKIVVKFKKLDYLHLQLSFASRIKDSGEFFSSLGCFPAVKYLNLELFSRTEGFKYSGAIKFVSQQENLQTLKFNTFHMLSNEYAELFQYCQKMKSLTNLSITEKDQYHAMRFDYEIVFQTLKALENLKSLKIHLGYYGIGAYEMEIFLSLLSSHHSLEKVDISMKMDRMSKRPYDFDEEFYQTVTKLRTKLWSFKLLLVIFNGPEFDAIYERVEKIIISNGKLNKRFACEKDHCS